MKTPNSKINSKKLSIQKETFKSLTLDQLTNVAGGGDGVPPTVLTQ